MNTDLPLANFSKFTSNNVDESQESVSNIFWKHRLQLLDSNNNFSTKVNEATVGESSLIYISYGTAVSINTTQLTGSFLIQVPIIGNAEITVNNTKEYVNSVLASIISPSQSMKMKLSDNCGFFTVRLSQVKIEKMLSSLLGYELQEPLIFTHLFDLSTPEGKSWLNAVNFARMQLEFSLNNKQAAPISKQMEETLCLMLLQLSEHNYQNRLHNETYKVLPHSIKKAQDYIHANIQQPISLGQLTKVTGIAPATLNKHFSYFMGQSPIKYVLNEKLKAVNIILNANELELSVTDIAMNFGFNHLGRFSEYYKRKFGELPSETYKRLK
jgi:AraC-like DNA-binding protein